MYESEEEFCFAFRQVWTPYLIRVAGQDWEDCLHDALITSLTCIRNKQIDRTETAHTFFYSVVHRTVYALFMARDKFYADSIDWFTADGLHGINLRGKELNPEEQLQKKQTDSIVGQAMKNVSDRKQHVGKSNRRGVEILISDGVYMSKQAGSKRAETMSRLNLSKAEYKNEKSRALDAVRLEVGALYNSHQNIVAVFV